MLVEQLDEVTPVCSVGSCYSYQNIAFSLIGDVTFAVTGDFFTHQVEKRIFHPLGMETATYGRDALEASGDWARPHVKRSGRWQSVYPKLTYYRIPPAAGVNASARDLGQWMLAHLGHAPDVLDSELLDTLHAPQIDTPGEVLGSPWRRAARAHRVVRARLARVRLQRSPHDLPRRRRAGLSGRDGDVARSATSAWRCCGTASPRYPPACCRP